MVSGVNGWNGNYFEKQKVILFQVFAIDAEVWEGEIKF